MSNNIYSILGKLKGINDSAALTPESTAEVEKVYESVEARGSITEAVRSLESKFEQFKLDEAAKPDFLDVDKDGNKAEPFKKAVKDKKEVEEGTIAKPKKDLKKHSATAKRMAMQKKADKGHEEWLDHLEKTDPDHPSLKYRKQATNEGQGPYELYNPKHPKFKANYDKFKAKNPDATLSDFVEAMKKREAKMNEAAYDEPEAPNADAVAKRKRLQAIKDRQEDERAFGDKEETNIPIRKVAGKAYGGAAQPADSEFKDVDDDKLKKSFVNKQDNALDVKWNRKKEMGGGLDLDEGIDFKDIGKIKNSAPNMKKAKLAKVTESRVMEETDYFYEKVGKALAEKNSYLDTASGEFADAVRKEMVAQGIPPNRARNILLMDEDFLSDVATSYGHYCQIDAHQPLPAEIDLGGMKELDEIAQLAGLSAPTPVQAKGLERSESALDETAQDDEDERRLGHYHELVSSGMDPDDAEMIAFNDEGDEELDEREQFQSMPKAAPAAAPAAPAAKPGISVDKSKLNPMAEEEMGEGNEFSGALAAAKASGANEFEVAGKRYTVKEDINVNITANGEEDALNLIRKLSGMGAVESQPEVHAIELPQDAATAIAQGIIEPIEVEVDEERDIEYANTPNEKIGPVGAAIPSGDDLNRAKKQYKKEYPGDNPMAVAEAKEDTLWNKYAGMLKGLLK